MQPIKLYPVYVNGENRKYQFLLGEGVPDDCGCPVMDTKTINAVVSDSLVPGLPVGMGCDDCNPIEQEDVRAVVDDDPATAAHRGFPPGGCGCMPIKWEDILTSSDNDIGITEESGIPEMPEGRLYIHVEQGWVPLKGTPMDYEPRRLYIPDFNPLVYKEGTDMLLVTRGIGDWEHDISGGGFLCRMEDTLACDEFRYNENTYRQYMWVWVKKGFPYLSIIPVTSTGTGMYIGNGEFNATQTFMYNDSPGWSAHLRLKFEDHLTMELEDMKSGGGIKGKDIAGYAEKCYGITPDHVDMEITLRTNDDIYITMPVGEDMVCATDLAALDPSHRFTDNGQYVDGMYLQGLITIYDQPDEIFTVVRSNNILFTPLMFARMIAGDEKINLPDDMVIEKPRFVNKTINNVYEMTARTDSRSNIIQPVFFRARELGNMVFHPAVSENISINLDAYKASVDTFILKVEGVFFRETGRVPSGVIFNIKGSMLPGTQASGTYYILNQDENLVTTGKYTYEQ